MIVRSSLAVPPQHGAGGTAPGGPRVVDEQGQASVELLAFVPLLVAITLLVAGALAGYSAREAADQAAVAAAVAELQGRDSKRAARDASPGWSRTRVVVGSGRATVRVEPRVPKVVAARIDAERSVVFDEKAAR